MRRKRSFVVLLMVLALLTGMYIYFSSSRSNSREEEKIEQKPVIQVSQQNQDKIVKIILENINTPEELIFERQVESITDHLNDESIWANTSPYPVELDQKRVADLAESFSALLAEAVVEDQSQNLAKYGLNDPSATAIAYLESGTSITLHLGNKTENGTGWYLMKQGDSRIYMVADDYGQLFSSTLSDFRNKEMPAVDPALISYLKIAGESRREIEIINKQKFLQEQFIYGTGTFFTTKPYKGMRGVEEAKINEIINNINGLTIEEFVDDQPTDYNKYGLDQPRLQLIARDDNKTILNLSFGNSHADGMVYFKSAESDGVYLMDESAIEFLNFEPFDIIDKYAMFINIEDVGKVDLEAGGREYKLSITRTSLGSEGNGEITESYFLDGRRVEEEAFKDLYHSMAGISIDEEKLHRAQGSPELKITYYPNKGMQNARTLELYPYDKNSYSLVLDGDMESEFLVEAWQLNLILDSLNHLIEDSSFG